ncbi:Brix-domain-containing protein [Lenzites betulinus]|nr:Brix-domain-containing protein [Lenzites betulinus]
MPPSRFEPSTIKNKIKREEIAGKQKKAKRQEKLQKRLVQAKAEANDPLLKKKRLAQNVPRTLDNTREFDPSILTANPNAEAGPSTLASQEDPANGEKQPEQQPEDESAADIANDPFAAYFSGAVDPSVPPKVLVTTSPKATRTTYDFCDELVGIFPGAEFIRRKKGKGFEMGRIAGWAANRGYSHLMVVNEDSKKTNAITMVYLPSGPTAYFKLTSVELSQKISGHARATTHYPELVLNGFVTRLGHTVGRLFQTFFPPMPEFQGRQVVTLHNQRDFLFFRRHRYAFRSTEKVALQEIGPRFTLKLRSLKKGLPAVKNLGAPSKHLEFDAEENEQERQALKDVEMGESAAQEENEEQDAQPAKQSQKVVPPTEDEFLWMWKPELETTRRTFFL